MPDEFANRRSQMVRRQIVGRGVRDARVIDAMGTVPRERFIPEGMGAFAYDDGPLPIGEGQTISQPYIVAAMVEAVEVGPGDRVLEVGTGSGYGAAVLAELAGEVWTIECHSALADAARDTLRSSGYDNVAVIVGDGSMGWPEAAPYDAIVVTAGGPSVPQALVEQLADGGRMVIPVGTREREQHLRLVRRDGDRITEDDLGAVRFVPLVGEQGWTDVETR